MRSFRWRATVGALYIGLGAYAVAETERTLGVFVGNGILMAGAEDRRKSVGVNYQLLHPEPRFAIDRSPGYFVWEAYGIHTWGGRANQEKNQTWGLGVLGLARWELGPRRRTRFFVEAGWGLQYMNRKTHDLDSLLNSTPTVGIGAVFVSGPHEVQATLRLMHISNGNTAGRNKGQNLLQLHIAKRL